MKTRHAAVLSLLSASVATNPCQRLCERDGPSVCTNGSWPRGEVCHAYFRRSDGHCYHNTETRLTCPDSLPALSVNEAASILGDSSVASSGAVGSSAASAASAAPRMRRVVRVDTTTERPTTTTETTTETPTTPTETTTETTTTSTPAPQRRRRVFPVGQAAVATPAAASEVPVTPAPEQRRRRVFPVGQTAAQPAVTRPAQPRQTWTTTPPTGTGHYDTYNYGGYRPVSVPQSFSTPVAAADHIGAAFDGRVSFDEFSAQIAVAFSRQDISSWPAAVTDEEAMDFWTRARGADLFALASATNSCAGYGSNECTALLMLISHMPLPNADENAAILFLERIGVMAFIDANIVGIRTRLQNSARELTHGAGGLNLDNRGLGVYRGFARNWPSRFPQIIGDSRALRAIVVRQRIDAFDLLAPSAGHVSSMQLEIDRSAALQSAARQFSRYNAATLRRGVNSVRYLREQAGGQGLTNEFYSVMAQAAVGSSSEAIFATHTTSGFERMVAGVVNPERYRTFGQYMALAVIAGNPTGIPLPPMFFRRLLGQHVDLDDVRVFDEDWFNVAALYRNAASRDEILAFSLGEPEPLPGSGATEPLTLENRDQQLQQAIENVITNNSPDQFAQIMEGFFFVLPREIFADIDGEDLQSMVVGNLDVSAADLIAHLNIGLPAEQAGWLRQIITEFTPFLRQRMLRFITGLSVVPVGGWTELGSLQVSSSSRTEIVRGVERIAMPRSQTCFKSMYMPLYESLEEMREILTNVLLHAIDAGMQER